MRIQTLFVAIWSQFAFSLLLMFGLILSTQAGRAEGAIVRDGDAIQLGNVTYRLDGIDAPALDQVCIDDHADAWACGIDARDQLVRLIGDR